MNTNDTSTVLAQLRTVLDLTNTEIQVADTRVSQARAMRSVASFPKMLPTAALERKPSKQRSGNWAGSPMSSVRCLAALLPR